MLEFNSTHIHTNNFIIRKYRFEMVVQGHFAVLKTMDVSGGEDVLSIEVVKMERQTSLLNVSQFLGKLYRCTKVQTSADCLEGRWYWHGNGRVTCEVNSVICTFPTLRGWNKLPKRACDAVIAEQMFKGHTTKPKTKSKTTAAPLSFEEQRQVKACLLS